MSAPTAKPKLKLKLKRPTPRPAVDEELAARERMTFEQAEGLEPLPSQLQPGEITQKMRSLLWAVIFTNMKMSVRTDQIYGGSYCVNPWLSILQSKHLYRDEGMIDEYDNTAQRQIADMKHIYRHGSCANVLGLTQFILRLDTCPPELADSVAMALEQTQAGYRLVNGRTIIPISDEHEARAIEQAFNDTSGKGFGGPRKHLQDAADHLSNGAWADSIRESIHAVEGAAKLVEPKANTLGPALDALAKKGKLHGSLRKGFDGLYGFTSDEKGIRHALLEKAEADVDEADAQFMLGACASFVSYLLRRARS